MILQRLIYHLNLSKKIIEVRLTFSFKQKFLYYEMEYTHLIFMQILLPCYHTFITLLYITLSCYLAQ